MSDDSSIAPRVLLAVDLVILTLRGAALQVLLIERGVEPHRGALALPAASSATMRKNCSPPPTANSPRKPASVPTGRTSNNLASTGHLGATRGAG